MLIPIHLIKHVNKTIEPKTVSNFLNLKKRETSKSFFNDEAMMDQLQETMQTYIYEFNNTDNPYEKFYYNLMYRFNSFKIDDKNIFSMSIDRLGYKKYLYEKLLEKYQDILVEPIKWEMIWDNIYETISRNFMNEFKNELDEVTEKYKNDHSSKKTISEISKKEFEENILDKINLHNIFDYTLLELFKSEEWKKVDPKYTEKTKHLSQKNPVVFKEIMQMIKFRTTQNNNEDWKLYQLIVINHGKYGYFEKGLIDSIKATWARQHKIGDFTKKTFPKEWTKEEEKQQEALKSLPKINNLGFKPSAGIKVPKPVKDIANSKLKKYQIENMRDLINKYNQDQEKQKKGIHPLPTKPDITLPPPTKPEIVLPLPTKPEIVLPPPTKPERVLPLPKPIKEKVINPTDKVTKVIKNKHPWYKNNKIFYIIGGIGGFFALLCSFIVWKKRIK